MAKLTPLAFAAVAALGACSMTTPPQTNMPPLVTNVHPYTPGSGVVQAVFPTPVMPGAEVSSGPMQRLEIRMDNGRIQYIDTTSPDFARGNRVVLTEDRLIRLM